MHNKLRSDGLGGTFGVSLSLRLGARKRLTHNRFNLLLFSMILMMISSPNTHTISAFSLTLAIQRSNEFYKTLTVPFMRQYFHVPPRNALLCRNIILLIFIANILLWSLSLLLLCGDVETNPGPDSVETSTASSSNLSATSFELLTNHLSILHLNIQSLTPKLDILRSESEAYDVLVFSESWLTPLIDNSDIHVEHFMPPFRTDRRGRPGGGVAIYVRDTLSCKRRPDLEIYSVESVWLELQVKSKRILIGGFYRPPNSNQDHFTLIKESIDKACNTNIADIVITGDFNIDMSNNNNNKVKELMLEYNLTQLISEPTHFTENSSSLIDLILVRNVNNILTSGVIDPFIADYTRYHCPVIAVLKFTRPHPPSFQRKIWYYKLADYDKFRAILSESNLLEKVEIDDNIDHNVQVLTETTFRAAEESIPNKTVTIKPECHPWITCGIKNLIRKRKRTYRKFKKTNNLYLWTKYKQIRNKTNSAVRKSKKDYFDNLDHLLSSENCNTKLFWKTSKQLLNLGQSTHKIPTLTMNHEIAETDLEKAQMLNSYFSSQTKVDDTSKPLPNLDPAQHVLESIIISGQDVLDVLKRLDVTKACGPDLISPRLLREGAEILARPYARLFNRSLIQGYFPPSWKEANLTPIHKKDEKSLPSNYRPISLLSLVGKTMERCIHKHLYNYVVSHQLITPFQSGFIKGDSTTNQLLHTYHTFCEAVDNGKEVRAVFCDISKAFDRVWHKGLLHKLRGIGCSDNVLKWFTNYLSGRRQRVVLNGESSDWVEVEAGVPQGSILGPLLFLLYINDIVKNICCSIRLFADDTSLYVIVERPDQAAQLLNADLQTISNWAEDWLVEFNTKKTMAMTISRKRNPIPQPPLSMNNTLIQETPTHKHLGLTFSNTCNWTDHVNNVCKKACVRLNLLRVLKFRVSRKSLEKMYSAFVRPLLEYSDIVWDNCSSESKKILDAIHVEAARIVTGGTKLCSIDKLFSELGWDSLQSRRNKHKLIALYKILHGLAPNYLLDLMPPTVQETSRYSLRNSDHFQNYRAKTNLFLDSFFPSTIRAWNSLPTEIREASSVAIFKSLLNRNIHSPPKYYSTGSRIGQILHARLRMGCSSLNSDLYRKNIVPSPSCRCGEFENAKHFLFSCTNYTVARERYLPPDLQRYTVNDLLCGKTTLSPHQNETLFLQVQNFIVKSGRFVPG
ncbi:MAG: reverse transcriptase domain-containing protein [Candidatus Thiodiazotropha taylori]|nr:hypothetical protein [Candidatus Thiodiazotropha taylori]MCW4286031.1 reverse transcriptase domain-containing protein [Candidatus Thiodiazotropha taylori]